MSSALAVGLVMILLAASAGYQISDRYQRSQTRRRGVPYAVTAAWLIGRGVAAEAAHVIALHRSKGWRWCSSCDTWKPPSHFLAKDMTDDVTRKEPPPK